MCGIVGVLGTWLTNTEKDIFKDLLTVSNLRGFQGAGVIVVDNKCNVDVFKTVETGTHLAHDWQFNQRIFHSQPYQGVSALIGHTRWPTKGAISLETTHPHTHGRIVGVHNGTLHEINGKYPGKDDSDSSMLYKSFEEIGVEKTMNSTRGAYSLVWVDQEERSINFLRNKERPMFYAMVAGGAMYFASERGMLEFVLNRRGIKYEILTQIVDKWSSYEFPLTTKLNTLRVTELFSKAAPVVAASPVPFLNSWTGTRGTSGGSSVIAQKTQGAKEETKETSGLTTPSGTKLPTVIPMGQRPTSLPASQQTPSQPGYQGPGYKPRKKWCSKAGDWVDINPLTATLPLPTSKTISNGGETVKSSEQKQESQSTEGTFCGDVLRHDEQMGVTTEEDFGNAALNQMFDNAVGQPDRVCFPGYRETIDNNWCAEEQYIKYLTNGCLWCGSPTPDVAGLLWTEVDEFLCNDCQQEPFAQDYACVTLGMSKADLCLPKARTA